MTQTVEVPGETVVVEKEVVKVVEVAGPDTGHGERGAGGLCVRPRHRHDVDRAPGMAGHSRGPLGSFLRVLTPGGILAGRSTSSVALMRSLSLPDWGLSREMHVDLYQHCDPRDG